MRCGVCGGIIGVDDWWDDCQMALLAAGVWRTGTGGVAHRLQSFFKSLLLALLSV